MASRSCEHNRAWKPWFAFLLLAWAAKAQGDYIFLGNVTDSVRDGSGITLQCTGDRSLRLEFLTSNMFRVTLARPGDAELLDYPLARTAWEPVDLQFEEDAERILVRSAELEVAISRNPCRLAVRNRDGDVLQQDDPGMGHGWWGTEVRAWKTIAPDERFFGLGEKAGPLNKRGREWVMWNTDNPHHDDRSDPLYQSIPFFVGMRGQKAYGVYFNNSHRSRFNMGAGNRRYYSFSAEGGRMDYFFVYGPEISRVVRTYTDLTGRMPMPPLWSLGYQQCRWSYFPDTEVMRIARTFREKAIPADVIYLDIHYMDGYRVFTWDRSRFRDPAGMVRELERMGFRVVVIIDPGVKVDPEYRIAREGLEGGHFAKYPDGETYVGEVWPGPSYFPDFSRPETREWWGEQFRDLLDTGIRGFWNDMNEPAVWGQAFPDEVLFSDEGRVSCHKKMHNLYGFLMARACYEGVKRLRPELRPFVITRAGFAGEQRYTSVWTGDNQATEEHLAMGIRMLQGLGISGVPFVGTDVGGFGGTPSHELFVRWIQSALFAPFFRTHTHYGSSSQDPWSFGENVEGIVRRFIEKRYELLPYLYSLMREASQTGAPVIRPMFWHDQGDPNVYDWSCQEQFYAGERILVAPVTKEGHRLRKVYLPQGRWMDWNTGDIYEGGKAAIVEAPLDRLPMFLREGAIVPMREPIQYVGEREMDKLIVDVFPGCEIASFQLYEDDGLSFAHEQGAYRLTEFSCRRQDQSMEFAYRRLHDGYRAPERTLILRFRAVEEAPDSVHMGEKRLEGTPGGEGWRYDAASRTLTVQFADRGAALVLVQ